MQKVVLDGGRCAIMSRIVKGKHLIRVNTPCPMASGAVAVTVEVQESTTVGEVKRKVLKRFKPGLVDPNLFTVSELVEEDDNTHSCLVLRDEERLMRRLWRHSPAVYSLDANKPIFVKIHRTETLSEKESYKTIAISEKTTSLEALRIFFQRNKSVSPEDYFLFRQDLRDFGEQKIKPTEKLSDYCKGPYAKIFLKKKGWKQAQWDESQLSSFIDYDSLDEGLDDDESEQGSSRNSSVLEFFSWMSDSVVV